MASMSVYAMHGIVDEWRPSRQVDRNYVSRAAFLRYLCSRTMPFSDWQSGSEANGDVLTVDDSTMAGAAACLVARALGHAVIFFINPFQIERHEHYYFSTLDAHLDGRGVQGIQRFEQWYPLGTLNELKTFRLAVREQLMDLSHEEACQRTSEVGIALRSRDVRVPPHLAPVDVSTLRTLVEAGVRIENHGWDHTSIRAMSAQDFSVHVERARQWFEATLKIETTLYSVPYGFPDLSTSQRSVSVDQTFILDGNHASEELCCGSVNRIDLTGAVRTFE